MPPTWTEALRDAPTQTEGLPGTLTPTEGLPDVLTQTEGLPDTPTHTEGLPGTLTPTEGLPDVLTQTEGLPDTPTHTGGLPDTLTPTEGLPDTPTQTGGLPDMLTETGALPDVLTQTGGLPDAPSSTGTGRIIRLNDEIRAFIVRGLARFDTPSQVAAEVRSTFGIEISRQLVYKYDPDGCKPPAQRWIDLHAATRARFLAELHEIGIAQKAYRLQMLDRFARDAEDNQAYEQAAAFLQQAAKECGDFYVRRTRRRAASRDGCPGAPNPATRRFVAQSGVRCDDIAE